jgi:ATP-dependent RNA helicase DeaD
VAPTPIKAPPRRHSKPRVAANGDGWEGSCATVIVSEGRAAGLEPSDIIHAITAATQLDGESVRNVRVLERFSFVEVPQKDAERVIEQTGGTEIRGRVLRLELART